MTPFLGLFDLFCPFVGPDGPLDLTEHLGRYLADRRTQHIGRRLGIEVEHIHEIFRLKTALRVLHTAGAEHILDAGLRRPPKGHPYVELTIRVDDGIDTDADDVVEIVFRDGVAESPELRPALESAAAAGILSIAYGEAEQSAHAYARCPPVVAHRIQRVDACFRKYPVFGKRFYRKAVIPVCNLLALLGGRVP